MLKLDLNLLWTVVDVLILYVLLRKFLFKPIQNVLDQRQKTIEADIAAAQTSKTEAAAALTTAQDKLRNVDKLREADAQATALARSMCEKLLKHNLTAQDDDQLLDDLLQKAGAGNGN